jgi:cytochrome c2
LLASGELLSTEHAQRGGDELNLIEQGSNYGWPTVTYGTNYETYDWPSNPIVGKHDGFKKPLYAWVPSLGISQLVQVTNFHQRWNSDILVSSLKAGTLSRVRYEEGAVRYVEPIWIGPRLRDIVEAEDRRIILWTDSAELLFLTVDETELARNSRQMHSVVQPANVSCMNCHHAGPTNPTHAAPSLSKIIGRPIASDNFANYSPSLKAKGGVWSEDNLRLFLTAPQKFSPGTSMVISEMTNRDLNEVLKFLRALD